MDIERGEDRAGSRAVGEAAGHGVHVRAGDPIVVRLAVGIDPGQVAAAGLVPERVLSCGADCHGFGAEPDGRVGVAGELLQFGESSEGLPKKQRGAEVLPVIQAVSPIYRATGARGDAGRLEAAALGQMVAVEIPTPHPIDTRPAGRQQLAGEGCIARGFHSAEDV